MIKKELVESSKCVRSAFLIACSRACGRIAENIVTIMISKDSFELKSSYRDVPHVAAVYALTLSLITLCSSYVGLRLATINSCYMVQVLTE